MALYTTPDGRVVIGTGVSDGNDYHGYNGKRDIVIQLTADGATDDGLNALEYLKAYATNAKAENKPIFPDGTRVFISTNGYTKAVEADDVVIDGDNITIGGIVWNGSAWDYTNAGQSGGGSSGGPLMVGWTFHEGESGEVDGQPYVIEPYFELDKTWQEISDADIAILSVPGGKSGKQIGIIEKIYISLHTYKVDIRLAGEKVTFDTSASSDYPRMNAPQP